MLGGRAARAAAGACAGNAQGDTVTVVLVPHTARAPRGAGTSTPVACDSD